MPATTILAIVGWLYMTACAALLAAALWIARSIQQARHQDAAADALDQAEARIRQMGPRPAAADAIAAIEATRQALEENRGG